MYMIVVSGYNVKNYDTLDEYIDGIIDYENKGYIVKDMGTTAFADRYKEVC